MECATAYCGTFVVGKGFFCRRYNTWAGVCQQDHKETDNAQRENAGAAPAFPVQKD